MAEYDKAKAREEVLRRLPEYTHISKSKQKALEKRDKRDGMTTMEKRQRNFLMVDYINRGVITKLTASRIYGLSRQRVDQIYEAVNEELKRDADKGLL